MPWVSQAGVVRLCLVVTCLGSSCMQSKTAHSGSGRRSSLVGQPPIYLQTPAMTTVLCALTKAAPSTNHLSITVHEMLSSFSKQDKSFLLGFSSSMALSALENMQLSIAVAGRSWPEAAAEAGTRSVLTSHPRSLCADLLSTNVCALN